MKKIGRGREGGKRMRDISRDSERGIMRDVERGTVLNFNPLYIP